MQSFVGFQLQRIIFISLRRTFGSRCLRMSKNTAVDNNHPTEQTFQYQDRLPNLPVPALEQSCNKYLESVKALVDEEQYNVTEFIVNEFCSGVGKQLQEKLEKKAKASRNWLERWWEDVGYLIPRSPVAPYINIGGPIATADLWPPMDGCQVQRAALFTNHMLRVWELLYRQERRVDKMGPLPMCMHQYRRLFSSCRVPGKEKDYIQSSFQIAPRNNPRHIIVLHRGRIFSVTVLDDQYRPFTAPEIESQLQKVVNITDSKGDGPAVCSLTGEERDRWYELREKLLSLDKSNVDHLETIQRSLFVVTLEVTEPVTDTEVSNEAVGGDCRYRWFDKSLLVLVFKNGRFATHCDHVHFDGIIEVDSVIDACKTLAADDGQWKGSTDIRSELPEPVDLEFKLDSALLNGIDQAIHKYTAKASDLDIIDHSFEEYGKGFSKSQKIHPDTYMQLTLQLTYYRLHEKPVATYETAQTRQFYHGRTDTVRSCTVESINWTKAMMDPEVDATTKEQLLRQAIDKHNKLMKEAVYGQGFDRHLLGLQLQAAEDGLPTPKIFVDKSWATSGGGANFGLSTSCVGFTAVHGGCAPMIDDGYGAFYSIEENRMTVLIATWKSSAHTDGRKFAEALDASLQDVRQMFLQNAKL